MDNGSLKNNYMKFNRMSNVYPKLFVVFFKGFPKGKITPILDEIISDFNRLVL